MKLTVTTPINGKNLGDDIYGDFMFGIGVSKRSDDFVIRLATPAGLSRAARETDSGTIIASWPLVVIDRWSPTEFEKWLYATIESCKGATWDECVENLKRYFRWEFDGYRTFDRYSDRYSKYQDENLINLVIRSAHFESEPGNGDAVDNLRTWVPENPRVFDRCLVVSISPKGTTTTQNFSIRVATPAGLENAEAENGIISSRGLVVMEQWSYEALWEWLNKIVSSCEDHSWNQCIQKLRKYFDWENDSSHWQEKGAN